MGEEKNRKVNVKGALQRFIPKFCFLNTPKTKKAVIFIRSRSEHSARLTSNYVLGGQDSDLKTA